MSRYKLGHQKRSTIVVAIAIMLIALLSYRPLVSARPFLTPVEVSASPTPTGYFSVEGGTFYSLDQGFQVVIPPGTLQSPAIVTAYALNTVPKVNGYTVIGQPYCFAIWLDGKPLLHLDPPAHLVRRNYYGKSIVGKEKSLVLGQYDEKRRTWQILPGRVNIASRTADAQVSTFIASSFCDKRNQQILVALLLPTTDKARLPAKATPPKATTQPRYVKTPPATPRR